MGRAEAESNQPNTLYPNQRIAGFTGDTNQAFDITRRVADRGMPELNQASQSASGSVNAGRPDIDASRLTTMNSLYAGSQNMGGARSAAVNATGAGEGDINAARNLTFGSLGQGAMETGQNRSLAQIAGLRGLGASGYSSSPIEQSAFGQQQADQYMSPYMNNVIQRQKDAALRDYNEGRASRETQAINQGAFGGYRDAIQQGVAQRGLANRMNDIDASGRQQAYANAQQQYNADRAASIGAQSTTENQRLAAAQYGLSGANLSLQSAQTMGGLTTAQQSAGLQGAQALGQLGSAERSAALQQAGLLGQLASTEQSLGYQGAESLARLGSSQQNAALQQSQALAQIEAQRQGLTLAQAQALNAQGTAQQNLQQRQLDTGYQDFINQRDYPKNQISYMSNILRGVPVTPTTVQTQYSNPNPLSQYAGLGIAGLGLARSA
jgi:hypothetical protein